MGFYMPLFLPQIPAHLPLCCLPFSIFPCVLSYPAFIQTSTSYFQPPLLDWLTWPEARAATTQDPGSGSARFILSSSR